MEPFKQFNQSMLKPLNRMWAKLEKMFNIRGDEYINFSRVGPGITAKLNIEAVRRRIPKVSGGGGVRKAFLKTVPGAVSVADCYLDTDTTGDEITVNFSISRGTALNAALPRLQDGDLLFVHSFGGDWWCVQTFHGSEDCVCS